MHAEAAVPALVTALAGCLFAPADCSCFSEEFTEERCCNPPEAGGDPSCWAGPFTFNRCCPAKDWRSCWQHRDGVAPWLCCHPAFGTGGNRACWREMGWQEWRSRSVVPALKYTQCCQPRDRRLLPAFPSLHEFDPPTRLQFVFLSYMDWLARCEGEHAAHGLFKDRPVEWMGSVQYELYFWFMSIEDRLRRQELRLLRQLDPRTPLEPGLVELLGPDISPTRGADILDVGAGPLTTLGKTAGGIPLRVVAADPLSCMYGAMLRQLGLDPPAPSVLADAELLPARFPEASFDMIHCRNALDHAWDPIAGLEAMLRLVRPGGAIYLLHDRNEGRRQNYTNLHSWDFDVGGRSGADLVISSPASVANRSVNVRRRLRGRASVEAVVLLDPVRTKDREPGHDGEYVEAVIRRPRSGRA